MFYVIILYTEKLFCLQIPYSISVCLTIKYVAMKTPLNLKLIKLLGLVFIASHPVIVIMCMYIE